LFIFLFPPTKQYQLMTKIEKKINMGSTNGNSD
jgi:hypothetical protein